MEKISKILISFFFILVLSLTAIATQGNSYNWVRGAACLITGCTMEGDIDMGSYSIINAHWVNMTKTKVSINYTQLTGEHWMNETREEGDWELDGSLNVTQNITADYFKGDGSLLTGVSGGNCSITGSCSEVAYMDYQNNGSSIQFGNSHREFQLNLTSGSNQDVTVWCKASSNSCNFKSIGSSFIFTIPTQRNFQIVGPANMANHVTQFIVNAKDLTTDYSIMDLQLDGDSKFKVHRDGTTNISNNTNVDGNITAQNIISMFYGFFNWTTADDWNNFNGYVLDFNESKLTTTYYNPNSSYAYYGTIVGAIDSIKHSDGNYDGITLNITEEAGAPGLDIRINYTGIDDFNSGVMRYKTSSLAGDFPIIQLWSYSDSKWEDYPVVPESESFATIEQPVFDSTEHIGILGANASVVKMRLYKSSNGNTNNDYYIDWIAIAKGYGTPAGNEVDPIWKSAEPTYWNSSEIEGKEYINKSDLNSTEDIKHAVNGSDFVFGNTLGINKIEDNSLVGWYQFSGNAKDSSIYGNDGTAENGVSFDKDVGEFDGVDDYVDLQITQPFNESFTISTWAKTEHYGTAGIVIVNDFFGLIQNNDYIKVTFKVGGVTKNSYSSVGSFPTNGEWAHIVTKYEYNVDNKWRIFINGNESSYWSYDDVTGSVIDSFILDYIGKREDYRFNGSIDDVKIYNRALSSNEILQLYEQGNKRNGHYTNLYANTLNVSKNLYAGNVTASHFCNSTNCYTVTEFLNSSQLTKQQVREYVNDSNYVFANDFTIQGGLGVGVPAKDGLIQHFQTYSGSGYTHLGLPVRATTYTNENIFNRASYDALSLGLGGSADGKNKITALKFLTMTTASSTYGARIIYANTDATGLNRGLHIIEGSSAGTHIATFVNGRIGIRTTTPTTELQIIGDSNTSGDIHYGGSLVSYSPQFFKSADGSQTIIGVKADNNEWVGCGAYYNPSFWNKILNVVGIEDKNKDYEWDCKKMDEVDEKRIKLDVIKDCINLGKVWIYDTKNCISKEENKCIQNEKIWIYEQCMESENLYACESRDIAINCVGFSKSELRCYPNIDSTKGYRDCPEGWIKQEV